MTVEPQMTRCPQCGQAFPLSVKLCPTDGTVLEHAEPISPIGGVLDGKYRLDAFLSRGGMGAVYKATHVMLGRTVAVKLINPEYVTSTEAVRRFQREARAATALNHANIVNVYDLGQTQEGTLYIAMEFVNGPSLKSVIVEGGPVAPARTIALLRQVAGALAVAHRHNIVHRDLKPQNIMLARAEDGGEQVKLVDFGIAKTFDDSTQLTVSGSTMGTPQYMAPEQAAGGAIDGRSDLYSLGIILYEMLSGEVPFNDKSATAIIVKQMKETPEPPSVRNPRVKVPAALEAMALRCLEKDPAKRFQTAEEFGAALEQAATAIGDDMASMEPTVLIARPPAERTQPSKAASAGAPTVRRAESPGKTEAPTVRRAEPPGSADAPAPASTRMADTRATVARAPVEDGVGARRSSNKAALAILGAVILLASVGAALFLLQRGEPAPASVAGAPPAATPAMAAQSPPQAPAASSEPPPQAVPASAEPRQTVAATQAGGTTGATGATSVAPTVTQPPGRGPGPPVAAPAPSSASRTDAGDGRALTPAARPVESAPQRAPAEFPENPAVYFHCSGAPEICAALRNAVDEALDGGGLSSVRSAARADIDVAATVEGVEQRISQQFQTTFAVRTYAIEVSAETTRTDEAVAMPPVSNLSFDPQFGSARIAERARLVAADIVERVKAFVKKKRGG